MSLRWTRIDQVYGIRNCLVRRVCIARTGLSFTKNFNKFRLIEDRMKGKKKPCSFLYCFYFTRFSVIITKRNYNRIPSEIAFFCKMCG